MNLGRNIVYNLGGSIVPLILALLTVPIYIRLVGVERYGALAIAWLILGVFGFFDMGLGRATAQRIAALVGGTAQQRSDVFWTAMTVNIAMGVVGGFILYGAGWYFFTHHFEISDALRAELVASLPILAAAVPVATATGVAYGALQGREMFLEANINTIAGTSLFQLLPLFVAWQWGPTLQALTFAAVVARTIGLILFLFRVHQRILRGCRPRFDRTQTRALFVYGGWVTITSLVSPMLVVVDRFMIGATISAVAVAIYAIPVEITQRIALLPRAMGLALFPRMAAIDSDASRQLSLRMSRALALLVTPPVLFGIFAMRPFLDLWVGNDLAVQSAPIGTILLLGYWINAFAVIPYSRLQASGRPDLVTKSLIAEVPFYLGALYFSLRTFGLAGAAVVFGLRTFCDYFILTYLSHRTLVFPREMAAAALLLLAALAITFNVSALSAIWWATFAGTAFCLAVVLSRNIPTELEEMANRLLPKPFLRLLVFR